MNNVNFSLEDGDVISIRNYAVRVKLMQDTDVTRPWKECDGMGVIRETTNTCRKRAGERIFGGRYMFDVAATTAEAKRDSWGVSVERTQAMTRRLGRQPTRGEIVAQAVEEQYEYLVAWANDDWQYCGYKLHLQSPDKGGKLVNTGATDSCYGFEYWPSDDTKNQYLYSEIRRSSEYLVELAEKEGAEVRFWNERDVVTTS